LSNLTSFCNNVLKFVRGVFEALLKSLTGLIAMPERSYLSLKRGDFALVILQGRTPVPLARFFGRGPSAAFHARSLPDVVFMQP
jgi:hypothetical protein